MTIRCVTAPERFWFHIRTASSNKLEDIIVRNGAAIGLTVLTLSCLPSGSVQAARDPTHISFGAPRNAVVMGDDIAATPWPTRLASPGGEGQFEVLVGKAYERCCYRGTPPGVQLPLHAQAQFVQLPKGQHMPVWQTHWWGLQNGWSPKATAVFSSS